MKQKIFDILDVLTVSYKNYEHKAVFTCDEAKGVDIPGLRVKSLLLKNKKSTQYYMVVVQDYKKLDVNTVRRFFNDSKLSFISEELMLQKISLKPGSVSPFALINNQDRDIRVVFDSELEGKMVGFHPLQNDNTIVLSMIDVEKFLDNLGIEMFYISL